MFDMILTTSMKTVWTKPLPYFFTITIWVCHYMESLIQSSLYKGSLKNGHFGQVAIFMKRLAFPSSNLIRLMGF